ncbi:hypothetical protein Phi4:1_gp109 [Cellulophaga phage phi4:1]|uniref:Uncharacterized protein n=3 Tax=Lightbulbvirus Cba41 TaxID=1918524 RepID=A0A0S2MWN3_9CAUD|nr:hypothetical protein Phi4:1_gp109 [Cellulophaga phage phi4:1]AGO49522.1 hypothetical protein Phi4:1_gp109 [Cellulophaga phage phi4:1]ALO80118.1 hypothetical protein Phi4113_109 [Cellulophaga phage phi4:1_13]ALO80315.1 hypothetical protein Phi4118_109 [Cellulophaga phage phi4:1_18]
MTIEELIASKTKTMTDLGGKKTKVLYLKDESEIEDFKNQLLMYSVSDTFKDFYKPTFEQFIKGSKLTQGVDGKYFYEDSLYTYAQLFCKYKKLFDL